MTDAYDLPLSAPAANSTRPRSHLTYNEQLADQVTPLADKHLAECALCRTRRDTARAHAMDPSRVDPEILDPNTLLAEIDALVAQGADSLEPLVTLPAQITAVLSDQLETHDVEPGQLWRLSWGQRHVVVAVIALAQTWVSVAPVTTDVEFADEYTWVLRAHESPLAVPLAIWVTSSVVVPLTTFDRLIQMLPPISDQPAAAVLSQLHRAAETDQTAPSEIPVGRIIEAADLERIRYLDALRETLSPFVGADAALTEHVAAEGDPACAGKLHELIRKPGMTLDALVSRTELSRRELLDLGRPGSRATHKQAQQLASALDMDVDSILLANAPMPSRLLARASRPPLRRAREAWAQEHDTDRDASAWELAEHAYTTAMAARTETRFHDLDEHGTVIRTPAEWDATLAMVLHDEPL